MNTESDAECTCDIGVFATCPVCDSYRMSFRKEKPDLQASQKKKKDLYPNTDFNRYLIHLYNTK